MSSIFFGLRPHLSQTYSKPVRSHLYRIVGRVKLILASLLRRRVRTSFRSLNLWLRRTSCLHSPFEGVSLEITSQRILQIRSRRFSPSQRLNRSVQFTAFLDRQREGLVDMSSDSVPLLRLSGLSTIWILERFHRLGLPSRFFSCCSNTHAVFLGVCSRCGPFAIARLASSQPSEYLAKVQKSC